MNGWVTKLIISILGVISAAAIMAAVSSQIEAARLAGAMEVRMTNIEAITRGHTSDLEGIRDTMASLDKTASRLDDAVVRIEKALEKRK